MQQQQQQRHNQDIPHFVLAHIVPYLDKPNEIQVISHSARNFFRHEMNWTSLTSARRHNESDFKFGHADTILDMTSFVRRILPPLE